MKKKSQKIKNKPIKDTPVKNRLLFAFYALFIVCFGFIVFNAAFANISYPKTALIYTALPLIILLLAANEILSRFEISDKNYRIILIVFSVVMFISEFILGLVLRHDTWFDIGAIHKGAAEWVKTGTFAGYYEYFNQFPNNLGSMTFLYIFFKAADIVGIKDFYAVSVFITCIMLTLMMVLSSLICKKAGGTTKGIFILFLFGISPQFWFMGGAVYTDALSMLFPVLVLWLYQRTKGQNGKKRIYTYLLMGLAAAIGALIKFTVVIVVIAVAIDMCFFEKPKELLTALVCVAGVFAIIFTSFNGYIYSKHLDKEMNDKLMRPHIHWVMMGLKGDGRYNAEDYRFTDSFRDLKEKKEKDSEEVARRIKKLGAPGIFKLVCAKTAIDFGDGTYGISDFLNIQPSNKTSLHDWVLYDGKNYDKYSTYATALHIVLMFGMIMGILLMLINKTYKENKMLVPYLALIGIWLFLMGWETNRRYFSNFAPMIFISVSLVAHNFRSLFKSRTSNTVKK